MRKEDQYVQKPQPSYQGGSRITVEPIRDPKDIETIKRLLKDRPRDLLLFTMGINNGLRVGDLLKFKAGQVRHMKPGQSVSVREVKTGKVYVMMMNRSTYKVLQRYLEKLSPADEDFLFKSAKGKNKQLTTSSVNNLVQGGQPAGQLRSPQSAQDLRVHPEGGIRRRFRGPCQNGSTPLILASLFDTWV